MGKFGRMSMAGKTMFLLLVLVLIALVIFLGYLAYYHFGFLGILGCFVLMFALLDEWPNLTYSPSSSRHRRRQRSNNEHITISNSKELEDDEIYY